MYTVLPVTCEDWTVRREKLQVRQAGRAVTGLSSSLFCSPPITLPSTSLRPGHHSLLFTQQRDEALPAQSVGDVERSEAVSVGEVNVRLEPYQQSRHLQLVRL